MRERGTAGFAFVRTPWPCRVWVTAAVLGALVLPVLLQAFGRERSANPEVVTGIALVALSVLNIEIGRLLEGGASDVQRPHKALSAWSFASALLLPAWWLLPVVATSYAHARWRGLRIPLWKWVGSAAYIVLAGLAAAVVARAALGADPNLMRTDGRVGMLAVLASAAVFLAVEAVLFHGSAYLNDADDEVWLRQTLRSPSFYFTEAGVLAVGGLSAAIWTGGPWFLALLLPVYALAQRAALHEPLRERAEHDDKTGLLRFESWRRLAVSASHRCTQRGRPWCVLFTDLDHFKDFNEAHGHLAGDRALVAAADAIRSELRASDLVGRFGGEEFCVFLPDVDGERAAATAERVRRTIEAARFPGDGRITVSIGLAVVPPGADGAEFVAALTTADRALFEAKAAGRNRVRLQVLGAGDADRGQVT